MTRKIGRIELAPLVQDLLKLYRRTKGGEAMPWRKVDRDVLDRAIIALSLVLEAPDPAVGRREPATTATRGPAAPWTRPPEVTELFDVVEELDGLVSLVCRGCGFEFTLTEGGRFECPNCGRKTVGL